MNTIGWAPSLTYFLIRKNDNKIIGMINLRYNLTEEIFAKGGSHIGYRIRPTERRKGYATYMLKEALIKCKERGMGEVILGCYEDNFGSNKTIINNNGVLYKKSKMKDKDSLYYKINL